MIRLDDQSNKDPNSTTSSVGERNTAMQDAYVEALLVERAAMARAGKKSRLCDVNDALAAAGYQTPPAQAAAPAKRTAVPRKGSTRVRPDAG